ncbi:BRO family protein [Deinococcus radiophilus]|uniref:BRO family protein n=1 Tax=Deinococcus radiophilus TaxID=32062 RepID=UPI003615089A
MNLQKFDFHTQGVRVVVVGGQPWFIGRDVAVVLGYANPQKAIRDHVDEEDRGVNESLPPPASRK